MLGLFKTKAEKLPSSVSPELHAQLKRETTFPHMASATADTGCNEARVDGVPPAARFVPADFAGATLQAFRIASRPGLAPLSIINTEGDVRRPQVWELQSDTDPTFVRQVPVQFDPAEKTWIFAKAVDVGCLPGPMVALGIAYATARPSQYVAVYDRKTHQLRKLGDAVYKGYSVHDAPTDSPDNLFEMLDPGHDQSLLLYHADALRVRAEVYVRKYDHILVFSPRYPQGLEILKLGLDDGNVVDWAMIDKTLWLHTQDRRNDKQTDGMVWSLDLSSVL